MIEESVNLYVAARLSTYNYNGSNVVVREAFPTPNERAQELLKTTLAIAISFDDGGKGIELGSTLTEYTHTVECWVFATTPKFGRNLTNVLKAIVRHEGEIPLLDISNPLQPVIGSLYVDRAASARQLNNSPRPWDQNVHTLTIRIKDEVML